MRLLSYGDYSPTEEEEEELEGTDMRTVLLCSPFVVSTLCTLSLIDLVHLEATCKSLQLAVNGEQTSHAWRVAAHTVARRRGILLPEQVLVGMTLPELKTVLSQLAFAHGCGPVVLIDCVELRALANICAKTASSGREQDSHIIAARLFFDEDQLETVARETQYEDLFCFCSEAAFGCPRSGIPNGSMLIASLGCRKNRCVLEIYSSLQPLNHSISLGIDLHLVSLDWPKEISVVNLKVKVNSGGVHFAIPDLDVTDKRMQQTLGRANGVLCILVVHTFSLVVMPTPALPRSFQGKLKLPETSTRSLNALALEIPNFL